MAASILSVVIISLIAAALAALLVLSDRFISNYGPCSISINDKQREFTVKGGGSLLESLTAQKIFIPSACGGRATCGYCKVKVLQGGGALLPTEEPFLTPDERRDNVRLSCMVKVRKDLRIEIPPDLLAVREFTCRCAKILDLTHDMKQFSFELREPAEIRFTPGQYMQLKTPRYNKHDEVYRAYSIASDPAEKNKIDLVIRLVPGGICTTYCFNHLKPGDTVYLNGPYGEFHLADTQSPMIFIAGGSGMAPFRSVLHHMANTKNPRKTIYFFGANRVDELCYLDAMKQFEETLPDFTFVPVVARPEEGADWKGQTGLVTEALARQFQQAAEYEAYLCGSPGMIDAAIKVLKKLGVLQDKIFYDKFA